MVQYGIASFQATVPNVKLWDFDSPNLHILTVTLGNNVDAISVRFGCGKKKGLQPPSLLTLFSPTACV